MLGNWSRTIRDAQRIREALSEYSFVPLESTFNEQGVRREEWSRDNRRVYLAYCGDKPEGAQVVELLNAYAIDRGEHVEISLV